MYPCTIAICPEKGGEGEGLGDRGDESGTWNFGSARHTCTCVGNKRGREKEVIIHHPSCWMSAFNLTDGEQQQ
jgi:hypothetical protein